MTRLQSGWIQNIQNDILRQQQNLFIKTGLDFAGLAAKACGLERSCVTEAAKRTSVAVVPVTTGLGVIGAFAKSVAAIAGCMGFEAFVTDSTDVNGLYEAHQKGAHVYFMADDLRFIAVNTATNTFADNNEATAKGFLAALDAVGGGLTGKRVLVAGCGTLGQAALLLLQSAGARPVAYDTDASIRDTLNRQGFETIETQTSIAQFQLIFDATSSGCWLKKNMLHPDVFIAAPGVPLSLDGEAFAAFQPRLIHDLLPIGVATMMAQVCS